MKRSEIQQAILWAKDFLKQNNFALPMFADWTPEEWRSHRKEAETIIRTMRGWDVTTFGSDDFSKMGAVLFTIRNGLPDGSAGCPYAEKLIMMKEGQVLPNHFHWQKTEDIINRGGGVLLIRVHNSLPDGSVDREGDVRILTDGIERFVPAGTEVAGTAADIIFPLVSYAATATTALAADEPLFCTTTRLFATSMDMILNGSSS